MDGPSGGEGEWSQDAPPNAARVVRRALVLACVSCRGMIDRDANLEYAVRLNQALSEWLRTMGLEPELEPDEAALLRSPLGSLAPQQRVDAGWRSEGMYVLAWALGRS